MVIKILKKVIRRIYNKIKRKIKSFIIICGKKRVISQINFNDYSKIIVFENGFGWDMIMKQRPQQIAANFDDQVLFLYHSNVDHYNNIFSFKKMKHNLLVLNLDIYRSILQKKLKNYNNTYLMIYSTSYFSLNKIKKYSECNFKIIYEYVDDFDEKLSSRQHSRKLKNIYDDLVQRNDVYFITTASKLLNNVLKDNPNANVKLITNGVDYDHFAGETNKIPKDMSKILKSKKKIIGYYGALASWFDYELIKKISRLNQYEIILLGVKYDDSYDKSSIFNLKNVHYLGKKDYDELPNYAKVFDLCIIPFVINDITQATSPVKLFEYMALGKPIVTTDMPECRKYKSVLIGRNHQEFIEKMEDALKLEKDLIYKKILQEEALANTWHSKCNDINNFISEVSDER